MKYELKGLFQVEIEMHVLSQDSPMKNHSTQDYKWITEILVLLSGENYTVLY